MPTAARDVASPQSLAARAGRIRLGRELLGMVSLALVAAATAGFAHAFRRTSLGLIGLVWGSRDPTEAARGAARPAVAIVAVAVVLALVLAGWLDRWAGRRRGDRLGVGAVATAARGEGPGPSLGGTLVRAAGIWVATTGLASVGREGAILETGGALGSAAGRRLGRVGRLGPALAAGGIAAGFAAAYHAPIAGALYVEEHLGVRHDRRSSLYTVLGAGVGYLLSVAVVGGGPVLARAHGSLPGLVVLALVGVVPAAAGARLSLELRERATRRAAARPAGDGGAVGRRRRRTRMALSGLAAALAVAVVPLTAGNGLEALHHAVVAPTLGVGLALAVGKLLATTAALGSGSPGGAFSPTLTISGGWALLAYMGLESLGVPLPGTAWDGMLVAMAVGVAVGLRSPLVAVVVIAEMTGDLRLVPVLGVAVLVATAVDRQVDRWRLRSGHRLPAAVHAEDG